ncbi:hypothetical protein, partial [Flavobacterium sp. UBA7663]|uniref:hypothetical protein n=1 Tax=Flavobacterium sp. UBA7663 TaxID=1946557 RepID=UPI0025C4C3F3
AKRYRQAYKTAMKKKQNLLILSLSIITFFVIGFLYEIDYRILTRSSVKYFASFKIEYYGGKGFRIFETDIAFILTLIPISFFILSKNLTSLIKKLILAMIYLVGIIGFYCFYCYLESEFISITSKLGAYRNGNFMYHSNNINYRGILFSTIISTFVIGIVSKKIITKPAYNSRHD